MISNSISINRNVTMAVNIPTLIYALQNARDYLPTNILRLNPYQAIVAKSYFSVTRGWGYFIPSWDFLCWMQMQTPVPFNFHFQALDC